MRRHAFLIAASIALGSAYAPEIAFAKPPAAKSKAKGPGPTAVDKKIKISPDGLRWGMTVEEIARLYEKVFESDFVPLYKAVEPGPRMAELDAELSDKKQLVMRNKVEFGNLPSGLDNTPLRGEFSYNNNEQMTRVKLRTGVERYFFFFGNHLWKIYDVYKLGKKVRLGSDYEAVVEKLTKAMGKGPRAREGGSSPDVGLDQVDWQNKETVLRIIDHGGGKAAIVYVDRKVEENLEKLRTNKGEKSETLDSDVRDVTRPVNPDSVPPPKK